MHRSIVTLLTLSSFALVHPSAALAQPPAAASERLTNPQSTRTQETPTQVDAATVTTTPRIPSSSFARGGLKHLTAVLH